MDGGDIFIIGYMGAGKSTGGKRLAKAMGLPFLDLDAEVVAASGQSIPDLFGSLGENGFRALESERLRALTGGQAKVISTGGGTPCHGDNMDFMLESGTVVHFALGLDALVQRLGKNRSERPMLAAVPMEQLAQTVALHLSERRPFYDRAHITVDVDMLDDRRISSVKQMIEARQRLNP